MINIPVDLAKTSLTFGVLGLSHQGSSLVHLFWLAFHCPAWSWPSLAVLSGTQHIIQNYTSVNQTMYGLQHIKKVNSWKRFFFIALIFNTNTQLHIKYLQEQSARCRDFRLWFLEKKMVYISFIFLAKNFKYRSVYN